MEKKKDYVYKEMDAGHKELFSMLIYRPIATFMLNRFFKHINISPNLISFLSLISVIVCSYFFAFYAYPYMCIGILFLHLGYILDMLDGQYARYKGLSSRFGQWLDSFVDVIKLAFIFISLSYNAYMAERQFTIFLWGMIALTHSFLTFYILDTRIHLMKERIFEVKLVEDVYAGYEIALYLAVTLIVLVNKISLGLIFLATVGALGWIKTFFTLVTYYRTHKDQIEKRQ